MMTETEVYLAAEGEMEGAKLRLAGFRDIPKLSKLYQEARASQDTSTTSQAETDNQAETEESMEAWLELGGAMLLELKNGNILGAVRWEDKSDGWQLDPIATLPAYRQRGIGRWLLTVVESLAIKRNIASLRLDLNSEQQEALPYYQRLGYSNQPNGDATVIHLHKRVGGIWQMQNEETGQAVQDETNDEVEALQA